MLGPGAASAAPGQGTGSVSSSPKDERPQPNWHNATEYAQDHLRRFGTAPWSAVTYDGRGFTADPKVYRMSTRTGLDAQGEYSEGSCSCITEQGTAYDLDEAQCCKVARVGMPYNPYKQDQQQRQDFQQQPAQVATVQTQSGRGVALTAPQMASYDRLPAADDIKSE